MEVTIQLKEKDLFSFIFPLTEGREFSKIHSVVKLTHFTERGALHEESAVSHDDAF